MLESEADYMRLLDQLSKVSSWISHQWAPLGSHNYIKLIAILEENIFCIGRSREATERNTENIFSSNAINTMQNCRLKIAITGSFVSRFNRFLGKTNAKLRISCSDWKINSYYLSSVEHESLCALSNLCFAEKIIKIWTFLAINLYFTEINSK